MTTEQQILRRAIAGDEQAMRQLWKDHAPHIDAVVLRLCGDRDLAADVAQEVWMQIFRALPGYRGDAQFGTWAHRVAVNRTLNELRKIRRLARIEVDIEEESATTPAGVEEESNRTFLAESIEQAVQRLSPGARTVFTLHDIEGYTHEEIARELGITPGGSKAQLAKARARLRRMLAHLVDTVPTKVAHSHVTPIR